MNEGFVESNIGSQNTPEVKLVLTVFIGIFSYLRTSVMIPMIVAYGAAISIALLTLWSFVSHGPSLLDLPFDRFFPESFTLGNAILVQAWGIISLVLYTVQRIIEAITHKKFYAGYLRKIGLQLLILTAIYAFLIATAHLHVGWFEKSDDITSVMVLFYVITFITTLVSWMILGPLDLMLFFMHRAQLSPEAQQEPIALPWKKGVFLEKFLVKILERSRK